MGIKPGSNPDRGTKLTAFVAIPGVILLGLIVNAFLRPSNNVTGPAQADLNSVDRSVLEIEVTGDQFYWKFRYPGRDGIVGSTDDIVSSEELIVPLNRQIRLQLRSLDYIYVFEIPPLGIREIAVPELQYSVEFVLREPLPMDPLCAFGQFQNESMGIIRGDDAAWNKLIGQP
jgi:heme/copper-type cytochrome/quinol oxidase subunit 2